MAAVTVSRPEVRRTDELVGSIHAVMQSVLRRAHPALDAEGISMGQFWTLHLVSSLGSARVGTIARRLAVSAPTVCVKIDELEAAGLVSRQRSDRDRRAVQLTLTPKGRRVEARIWASIARDVGEAAATLPDDDLATAVRVFQELSARLSAESGPTRGGR